MCAITLAVDLFRGRAQARQYRLDEGEGHLAFTVPDADFERIHWRV